jgi:hypothetical protein
MKNPKTGWYIDGVCVGESIPAYERLVRENAEMRRLLGKTPDWHWHMLPNGMRGWCTDCYMTDDDIRSLVRLTGRELPKELDGG